MRSMIVALLGFYSISAMAMPCDTGWKCKSKSGKYSIEVQRCRYSNAVGNLLSTSVGGREVADAKVTAAYDSLSIGGNLLAIEVSVADAKNDAHYISFEYNGKTGTVTDRIQEYNPGPQKAIHREAVSCNETD